jgi:uncharacterized membrane protein
MKKWIVATYKTLAGHIGKIMAAIGTVVMSIDLLTYAPQVEGYAQQYLPGRWYQRVSVVLFVLLFIRTTYVGVKTKQLKQQLEEAKKPLG